MRHELRIRFTTAAVAAALIAGCTDAADSISVTTDNLAAASSRITFALPVGGLDTVPVGAAGELRVADRARVQLASLAPAPVANSGATLTELGVESRVGTTTSIAAVTMRDRAQVTGNVVSSGTITRGANTVVTGTVSPNTPLTFDRWSWSVALPVSGPAVSVPVNGSRTLAPGSYAGVQAFSGATLSLRAGTYFMDALTMEPQSRLAVDTRNGSVIIYARAGLTFRGSTVFTGPNDRLLVAYLGTTSPGLDRPFDGTLVAPNASVRLGIGGSPYTGAVYAKSVQIDPDVRFNFRRFAGWDGIPFDVEPRFNCVERREGGAFVGLFGYRNPKTTAVTIPVGPNNRFVPGVENRQQPTTFATGLRDKQFAVIWLTHPANWFLNGLEAAIDTTRICPANTAFSSVADTTVKATADRANFGSATTLTVGSGEHALVQFDRAAIARELGPNRLIRSARLELTVVSGPSTPIEVIEMRKSWTETGATWRCANDTNTTATGETCAPIDVWNMVRRDRTWDNPWQHIAEEATANLGTVQGGVLGFDVTKDAQRLLGPERAFGQVGWVVQAVGASGASATLRAREAGASVAPRLVIQAVSFTDFDVITADDTHAPLSITVDTTIVPGHGAQDPLVAGGPARPVVTFVSPDGTASDVTDRELLVFTDSASELSAVTARLGAEVVLQGPSRPGVPRMNVLRIDPARANPATLVPRLLEAVPGFRGRQRVSSDNALRLLAAAGDERSRGTQVALNLLGTPAALTTSALAGHQLFDGLADLPNQAAYCAQTVPPPGDCSSNDFDWPHLAPGMHDVPAAWGRLFFGRVSGGQRSTLILDAGFRSEKMDGLSTDPVCSNSGRCTNNVSCGSSPCPFHATDVVNAGFGEPGNLYGAAGTGWPTFANGNLRFRFTSYSTIDVMVNALDSALGGGDIINMSFSGRVSDLEAAVIQVPLDIMTTGIRATGTLMIAAAGNDGRNVDKERCYTVKEPISEAIAGAFGGETPLQANVCVWEESMDWPCEGWGVDCVEGTNLADQGRADGSNHGGSVEYAAVFTTLVAGIDTADDTKFHRISGTSISTPIVSGIASMIWNARPGFGAGDVERCLTAGSGKLVHADQALTCAIGSGNLTPRVDILEPADGSTLPPGQFVAFLRATAGDFEDGPLQISWLINGAAVGQSANGATFNFALPGPGTFNVTALVADSTGLSATDQITFHVVAANPNVVIHQPANGATVFAGISTQLRAQVLGRFPLNTCPNVRWSASGAITFTDLPGCLRQQIFPTPGSVTLTASLTDVLGTDSDTVTINVVDDGQARVVITSPSIGEDGIIHVRNDIPVNLVAEGAGIPQFVAWNWTAQGGTSPVVSVGTPDPSTFVTFNFPLVGSCGPTAPGFIKVSTIDALGNPVEAQITVLFEEPCEPR